MNTLLSQNLILIAGMVLLLAAAALFLVIGLKIGAAFGRRRERADWEGGKLEGIVRDRLNRSRAVLGGLASEQVAPFLPGFPFDPGDCRFVGKPVDFVVFKGMNQKDITKVIFLEVKSGASKTLNDQEKKLRDAVNAGKVRWEEFDVPEV